MKSADCCQVIWEFAPVGVRLVIPFAQLLVIASMPYLGEVSEHMIQLDADVDRFDESLLIHLLDRFGLVEEITFTFAHQHRLGG